MNLNLLIVGDNAVGKTSYLKKHKTGEFNPEYQSTTEIQYYQFIFNTNKGKVTFHVYDGCSIHSIFNVNIDCAIIMFDLSNDNSLDHVNEYYNALISNFGQIPIVVCGNKSDLIKDDGSYMDIYGYINNHVKLLYFDISTKTNYNFDKPFLFLIRQILLHTSAYDILLKSDIRLY